NPPFPVQGYGAGCGPALTFFAPGGKVLLLIWYHDGLIHRDNDLPAKIQYTSYNENVVCECWYQYGQKHRDPKNGPTYIEYDLDGITINKEIWYQYGKKHRNGDYPAVIKYKVN